MGLAVAALALLLALGVAMAGAGVAAYVAAANAADAAALAAAPVTFDAFGARGTPAQEAERFARMNGARLVSCACAIDRSWAKRTVRVVVVRTLTVPVVGTMDVRASSRATFEPVALIPDG